MCFVVDGCVVVLVMLCGVGCVGVGDDVVVFLAGCARLSAFRLLIMALLQFMLFVVVGARCCCRLCCCSCCLCVVVVILCCC